MLSYERRLPLYGEYDAVVLGGGPAGVAAAITATRQGMRVLLVESTARLGGMATSGLVGPFMTVYDRDGEEKTVGGIFDEIVGRLRRLGGAIDPSETEAPSVYTSFIAKHHRHVTPFSSFYLELLLDEMVREAGVEVLCYTQFVDVITEGDRIVHAVLNAPEGLLGVSAKVFIDATGIAAVAEKAGVSTYKGDETSGIPQPATLMFEVGGADDARYAAYAARPEYPVKVYLTPEAGRYKVNHYHVYGVDAACAESMTEAHATARRQVLDALEVLHRTPGFEDCQLLDVAPVLGVRESRHIDGEYRITVADVSGGTKFDDRIAVYGFGMDVHGRSEGERGNFKVEIARKYYIPYRALLPKGCRNLLVAGKTLSAESQAVGGMRCMPAAMAMGEASGVATALAVKGGTEVGRINVSELQRILRKQGAILD